MGKFLSLLQKNNATPEDVEFDKISDYIKNNEGESSKVYKDTEGNDTIGIGHKVLPGEDINNFDQSSAFKKDVKNKISVAKSLFPKYDEYPLDVKKALVDGVFRGEYKRGHKTVGLINKGEWGKVPSEYIKRNDYLNSKDKGTGVYKRMDRNAEIFRDYSSPDGTFYKPVSDKPLSFRARLADYANNMVSNTLYRTPDEKSARYNIASSFAERIAKEKRLSQDQEQHLRETILENYDDFIFNETGNVTRAKENEGMLKYAMIMGSVASSGSLSALKKLATGIAGYVGVSEGFKRIAYPALEKTLQGEQEPNVRFGVHGRRVGLADAMGIDKGTNAELFADITEMGIAGAVTGAMFKAYGKIVGTPKGTEEIAKAYEELGISKKLNPKRALAMARRQVLRRHPDRGGTIEASQKANEAYKILAPDLANRQASKFSKLKPGFRKGQVLQPFDKGDLVKLGDTNAKVLSASGGIVELITEAGKTLKMPVEELNSLGVENLTQAQKMPESKPQPPKTPTADPLIQEAQKYDKVEEFVKAKAIKNKLLSNNIRVNEDNTVTLYHASSSDRIKKIKKEGFLKGGGTATGGMTGLALKPSVFLGTDKEWVKNTWGNGRDIIEIRIPVEDVRQPAQNNLEVYVEGGLRRGEDNVWKPIIAPRSTFYDRIARMDVDVQQLTDIWNKAHKTDTPMAGGMVHKVPDYIKKVMAKGVDIVDREDGIRMDEAVTVKDIHGKSVELPEGHEFTPYVLSNGKIWLHDGKNLVVDKKQIEKLKHSPLTTVLKGFYAPEEEMTDTVVKSDKGKIDYGKKLTPDGWVLEDLISGKEINSVGGIEGKSLLYKDKAAAERALEIFEKRVDKKDATKFSSYLAVKGGENYQETFVTVPETIDKVFVVKKRDSGFAVFDPANNEWTSMQGNKETIEKEALRQNRNVSSKNFNSSHFEEPNIIVHIRHSDFTTPEGKKVLQIQEIQSDWETEGRKQGYKRDLSEDEKKRLEVLKKENTRLFNLMKETEDTDEGNKLYDKLYDEREPIIKEIRDIELDAKMYSSGIPYHPLLKQWKELGVKKALEIAVKGNYDYLALPTGEQTADLYDLSKQISKVRYNEKLKRLMAYDLEGKGIIHEENITPDKLENYIGKEPSRKLQEIEEKSNIRVQKNAKSIGGKGKVWGVYDGDTLIDTAISKSDAQQIGYEHREKHGVWKKLEGLDLKIGGEWAKQLYDKKLPSILKKLTGREIEQVDIGHKQMSKRLQDDVEEMKSTVSEYVDEPFENVSVAKLRQANAPDDLISVFQEYMFPAMRKGKATQPAIKITPTVRGKVFAYPKAGGLSMGGKPRVSYKGKIKERIANLEDKKEQIKVLKESLADARMMKREFRKRIMPHKDGFLKEEYDAIPSYFKTKKKVFDLTKGITMDEAADELGIDSSQLAEYLESLSEQVSYYQEQIKELSEKTVVKKELDLERERLKNIELGIKEGIALSKKQDKEVYPKIKYAKVPGAVRVNGMHNLSASVSEKEIAQIKRESSKRSMAAEGGFKAGIRAQRRIKKTQEGIQKAISGLMRVGNVNVSQEYRDVIDDSLTDLGIGKYKRPLKSKRKLRDFIEEQKLKGEIVGIPDEDVALADATTLENATLELLQNKLDVLKQVATLGRNENRLLSDISKQDFDKTVNNIVENIYKVRRKTPTEVGGPPGLPSGREVDIIENAKDKVDKYFSHHWKTEMIAIVLDGGKIGGPVHSAIIEPIQQGTSREMIKSHDDFKKVTTSLEKYTDEEVKSMRKDKQEILPGRPMTKMEAITIYINSKNPGNRDRLLKGWEFTEDQLKVVEDSLTPKDKRFAKELMEVAGSRWGETNEVVKAITGLEMGKVKDYFPIVTDKELDTQAKLREAQRNLFEDVFKRTSVQRGHTKARVGGVAPVDLDGIAVLLKHIQRSNKFSSVGKEVRDVQKIINDPRFKQAVVDTMGENIYNQFGTWLRDFANPRNHFIDEAESFAATIQHNATSAILGLKVSVSLLQGGSITQTIHDIGLKDTMEGLKEFWSNPAKATEFIYNLSPEMKYRGKYVYRDILDKMEDSGAIAFLKGQGDSLSFVFKMIQGVDKYTTLPSWLGAFRKKLKEPGVTEQQAASYANAEIRITQPSGAAKDLPAVARGSKFKKLWTMFYSFFSTYQNQVFRQWDYIRHGDAPAGEKLVNSAVAYFWLIALSSAYATFVRSGGKAKPKDYALGAAQYATSGLIGVRDVTNLTLRNFGSDVSTPATSGIKELGLLGRDIRRKIEGKNVKGRKMFERAFKLSGYVTGMPTAQGWVTLEGMMDLSSGQTKDFRRLFWSKYALGETKNNSKSGGTKTMRQIMNEKYGGSASDMRKRMNQKYGGRYSRTRR